MRLSCECRGLKSYHDCGILARTKRFAFARDLVEPMAAGVVVIRGIARTCLLGLGILHLFLGVSSTTENCPVYTKLRIWVFIEVMVIGLFIHFSNCLHVCCTHFACFRDF